jgi:hypothetical protein
LELQEQQVHKVYKGCLELQEHQGLRGQLGSKGCKVRWELQVRLALWDHKASKVYQDCLEHQEL